MPGLERTSQALLIAETNPRILSSLTDVVNEHMPEVRFDVCSTRPQVVRNVQSFSYDTVISNLRLADSVFLKRNQHVKDVLPLVITAKASDTESASRSLELGAFDVITYPLHPAHAVATIRLAIWYKQMLRLISGNERAVHKYRQCLDADSDDERMGAHFDADLEVVRSTLTAIEKTLSVVKKAGLREMAARIETQTRAKALARLYALYSERDRSHTARQAATKIMIVDDDPKDLDRWSSELKEHFGPSSVITVGTMDEALAIWDSEKIDCIVLDLDLSQSSGFELILELIPTRGRPTTAVVVLTRLIAPHLHQMALDNGAQACLVKQFTSPRELSDAIRKAIASTSTL